MNLKLASRSEEISEKFDCSPDLTNKIRGYTSTTPMHGLNLEEMSEKSDCVPAPTNRIRGYTSKTRLRGLNLYNSEFHSRKTFETTPY